MRADKFLAEKFDSRTKAAEAIEKGWVLVNGKQIRPKDDVSADDEITFAIPEEHYVSNGGYKLARALKTFAFDCSEKVCVDIGASTGGFTDCLLQKGAKKIYAVDVGESLLHESIKNHKKIISLSNINARYLTNDYFSDKIDIVVADVSFISLKYILPVIQSVLSEEGSAFVLVKPQFECENKNIGKSGIVHPSAHVKILEKVLSYCEDCKLFPFGIVNAPVRKGKNLEYMLYIKKESSGKLGKTEILQKTSELVKTYVNGILE